MSITEFFNRIERSVKSSNWTDTDKITVAVLKLLGAAMLFLNSNGEATRDDIMFGKLCLQNLRETFTERFRVKHLDQIHYSALQNAMQYRHKTPEWFIDM